LPLGDFGNQPPAAWRAAVAAGHVGLGPSLVDEDKASRIKLSLMGEPSQASSCDVGSVLLAGVQSFF
jgi:hypothetical protein